jgi:hypothetical protein
LGPQKQTPVIAVLDVRSRAANINAVRAGWPKPSC